MKVWSLILAVILMCSSVLAQTQINIYLDNAGNAEFLGESSELILNLPEVIILNNGQIRGTTSELTSKQGTTWSFNYELANSELVVFLPDGAVLDKNLGGEVFIDRGNIAVYNRDKIGITYHVEKSSKSVVWMYWIVIVVIALIGYYWYYRKSKKGERKESVKKELSLEGILHERQNLILSRVKETGRVKMSYLRKQCNMPKASFSRHIRELEKKKLVKLDGEGKNKFVSLT